MRRRRKYGTTRPVSHAMGADGDSNSAIYLEPAVDYVVSDSAITVAGSASRTLNFWFKSAQQQNAPVSYGGRTGNGTLFEGITDIPADSAEGHFWGYLWDTAAAGTGDQPSVTWDAWNMLTLTYDGTDAKLYHNGALSR